jgi:uncharacterized protein (DUF3820 family)
MTVMPFGQHKGTDIEDVPTAYLEWFLINVDAPPKGDTRRESHMVLVSEIESELESREKFGNRRRD